MATIKVQQKLGQDEFKKLVAQIKGEGVSIVTNKNPSIEYRTADDFLGKVNNAFNLGKKVEAHVEMKDPETPLTGYHFLNLSERWFLVQLPID